MEITIKTPQIDELNVKIDAMNQKIDQLLLATTALAPVQMDLPLTDQPKPAPKTKRAPRATDRATPAQQAVEPIKANGEDIDDDADDALRAQVAFEGKRVTRVLGIGGMRAAIRKVTGENILQVDDVPATQLPALLAALQGL